MPKPRVAVAAVAALAGVVSLAPAAASAAPAGRAPVRVHMTRTHAVVGPAAVNPGIANLHNSGSGIVLVLQPLAGAGAGTAARDAAAAQHGSQQLYHDLTLVAALRAHKSVFTGLHRGTLLFVPAVDKVSAAMVHPMHVQGAVVNAAVPASVPVSFDAANRLVTPTTIPTRSALQIANGSSRIDQLFLVRVGSDVTQQTIDSFVSAPTIGKLESLHPSDFRFFGPVSPRQRVWVQYWMGAGRWVVIAIPRVTAQPFHAGGVRALVVR